MPPTTRRIPTDRKPGKKRVRSVPADERIPTPADTQGDFAPTVWGSALGGAEDLTMPSGQRALVKRPGVEGLVKAGVLNDVDTLTALVDQKHLQKGSKVAVDVKSLLKDDAALLTIIHTVDRVVSYVVEQPQVFMSPNDVTLRKQGVIYTDMIDLDDKMFIFNYAVGGTRDFDQFRQQSEELVGDLDAESGVQEDPR